MTTISRYDLYILLHLTGYIEQGCHGEPLSATKDKYPILSERRGNSEHPPLDYFNRVKKSQEDANTHMIRYYAAMQSAMLRRDYRLFYVVHTEPDAACARYWKANIHSIADVMTPECCAEELNKPSKDSLFDFLDWAMRPKEKDTDAGSDEGELDDAPMVVTSTSRSTFQETEHTAY